MQVKEKLYVDFALTPQYQGREMGGEYLWCIPVDDNVYRVDAVPIFSAGIRMGDLVRVEDGNILEVVERSGTQAFHLTLDEGYFATCEWPIPVLVAMETLGCDVVWLISTTYVVSVPAEITVRMIDAVLAKVADGTPGWQLEWV